MTSLNLTDLTVVQILDTLWQLLTDYKTKDNL